MHRLFLAVALLFPVVACAQSPSERLSRFFAETFEQQLRDQPEFATNAGHHEYDDRWTDWSKAARELRRTHLQDRLKQLDAIPLDAVSDEDRLSARLYHYDTQQQLDVYDLQNLLLSVGQLFGFHNNVYSVIDRMPGRTAHDYENILARLRAVPVFVDQNITRVDEAIARGWVQPKVVVDLVLAQLDAQLAQDSANTPLLVLFRRFPSNITAADQERLRADGVAVYEKQFLPAWHKLRDYIASTYAPRARPGIGLGSLPYGRELYAVLIRRYTTTTLTADQIHKIG
jgi:uncharacterized protein (DUF885 family)